MLDFGKFWISASVWEHCEVYQKIKEKLEHKLDICGEGEHLANVDIRRGIFQGDSSSPLLFVICMILLTQIYIWKVKSEYTLKLPFVMDDLKNFEKSERDVNGLNTTVQVLINETGMRFRIKKGGVLLLKGGKAVSSEAVEMSDSERIKQVEEK